MKNASKDSGLDYKKLYEESLLPISKYEEDQAESCLTICRKDEELTQKDEQMTQLTFELDKFRKYLFGSKSEKLSAPKEVDLSQLGLFGLGTTEEQQEELSEQTEAIHPEKKTPKKRAKGTGRMTLPEELRREEIIIEPTKDVSDCKYMGDEVTEVLDLMPAELYVKRYVRRKYARPNGAGVVVVQLPERVIEKGIPSNRLVGEMMLDKYVYGLPYPFIVKSISIEDWE